MTQQSDDDWRAAYANQTAEAIAAGIDLVEATVSRRVNGGGSVLSEAALLTSIALNPNGAVALASFMCARAADMLTHGTPADEIPLVLAHWRQRAAVSTDRVERAVREIFPNGENSGGAL
jgi:hypothetical protein